MSSLRSLLATALLLFSAQAVLADSTGTVTVFVSGDEIELEVVPARTALLQQGDVAPVIEIVAVRDDPGAEIIMKFEVPGVIPTPEVRLSIASGPAEGEYFLESDWQKALFSTDAFGRAPAGVVLEGHLNGTIERITGADTSEVPFRAVVAVTLEQVEG